MKNQICCGYLLLMVFWGFGQTNTPDSLRNLLRDAPADSNRILLLLNLGNYYEGVQLDSAERYYRQALALSKALNAPFFEGKTISWFTDVLNVQGKLEEALHLNLRGLDLSRQLDHNRLKAASLANVAITYQFMGDYENTLKYQLESMPLLEKMGDSLFLSAALNNIAITFIELKQYEKAIPYAEKALQLAHKSQVSRQKGPPLLALGQISSHLNRSEDAMKYFMEALKVAEHLNDNQLYVTALLDIGGVLKKRGAYSQALSFLTKGLPVAIAFNEKDITSRLLISLGDVYFELKDFVLAEKYFEQAIDTCRKYGFRDGLYESYLSASYVALVQKQYDRSRSYRQAYHLLSDSIYNEKILKSVSDAEVKYQTTKKAAEIERLSAQNQIQQLTLSQKQTTIVGLGIVSGLMIGLGFLFFQNARNKQQLARQKIIQLEKEKQLSTVDAMLRGQEDERGRLARDLHDGLGGMLSGVKQTLNSLKGNQIMNEGTTHSFFRAIEMLDASIGELRRVARNMMPEALLKFGLKDAVQDFCHNLSEMEGLSIQYQAFGLEKRLPESTEVIIFRIVQELLNNVVKHANASQALLQFVQDEERFHITIEDDGQGFDPAILEKSPGIGWMNIRSRVNYLSGTLDLRSSPNFGTMVEIEFKLLRS